jgi:aminoglycoside phosphotransferase (APT) family kinase protein
VRLQAALSFDRFAVVVANRRRLSKATYRMAEEEIAVAGNAHNTAEPRLPISVAQAQAIIGRLAESSAVTRVTTLHGGQLCDVFEISRAERCDPLVVKIYPGALQWKMHKEANIIRLMQGRLSVPIPQLLLVDDTKSLLDFNFIVMSKLRGQIVLGLEETLPQAQLRFVYWQMGRTLREIHDTTMSAFGYIGSHDIAAPFTSNRAYMSFQFEKKLNEFVERGGSRSLIDQLRHFVGRQAHLLDGCTGASLCHYDFHAGNVLIEIKDGSPCLSGILDFENAIAGDPLMDIAKTLNYAVRDDEAKRDGLFAGYGAIKRAEWEETLTLYRMYCVLELWCWMAQIGNRESLVRLSRDLQQFL